MIIETLSTFPDMYASVMGSSMMRIAQEKGILEFKAHDLRDCGPAPDHGVPVAVRRAVHGRRGVRAVA